MAKYKEHLGWVKHPSIYLHKQEQAPVLHLAGRMSPPRGPEDIWLILLGRLGGERRLIRRVDWGTHTVLACHVPFRIGHGPGRTWTRTRTRKQHRKEEEEKRGGGSSDDVNMVCAVLAQKYCRVECSVMAAHWPSRLAFGSYMNEPPSPTAGSGHRPWGLFAHRR